MIQNSRDKLYNGSDVVHFYARCKLDNDFVMVYYWDLNKISHLDNIDCLVINFGIFQNEHTMDNILDSTLNLIKSNKKINKLYLVEQVRIKCSCAGTACICGLGISYRPLFSYYIQCLPKLHELSDALQFNKYIKYVNINIMCKICVNAKFHNKSRQGCICYDEKNRIIQQLDGNITCAKVIKILILIAKLKYKNIDIQDNKEHCILPKPIIKLIMSYIDK